MLVSSLQIMYCASLLIQGIYQPGKLRILREYSESRKIREMSGNFHRKQHQSGKLCFFSLGETAKDICSKIHVQMTQPTN